MAMLDIGSIDLEITNHCANGCKFCPHASMERPKGFMEMETFMKAVDLAREAHALITLSGMGDPLAHPLFFEFIDILRHSGVRYGIVINPLSLLRHQETFSLLAHAKVPSITVSFPSCNKDVFEELIPSCSFEASLQITLALNAALKVHGGKVRVQGLITSINRDERGVYLDFWKRLGVRGWVRRCHSRGGHLKNGLNIATVKRGAQGCWLFDVHTFIAWNGEILACCHDLAGESVMGNIACGGKVYLESARSLVRREWPPLSTCHGCDEEFRSPPSRIKKGFRRLMARNQSLRGGII